MFPVLRGLHPTALMPNNRKYIKKVLYIEWLSLAFLKKKDLAKSQSLSQRYRSL
jgi:hypothetical protein